MIAERMRVPVFVGEGRIEVGEKPVPVPQTGQLLIRVGANALCGSERGQFLRGAPVTPGHEAAGVVVATGPDTQTAVGTPGAVFLMDFCGECRSCRRGATNLCLARRGDMGFNRDGGYAPYELVHETNFFPTGPDISATEATLLLDIMGTGSHAIERGLRVFPDAATLAITGAGPIGLGVLAMAKILFGENFPVLIADVVPFRLDLAERLGGLPVLLAETTLEEAVKRQGWAGADMAIDTSGKGVARQSCLESLGRSGILVCVGHGEGLSVEVSRQLIAPERAVLGSEYFRFDALPANLERLRTHRAYLNQIITHRFPLERLQEAFELFFGGQTGKVVIEP